MKFLRAQRVSNLFSSQSLQCNVRAGNCDVGNDQRKISRSLCS